MKSVNHKDMITEALVPIHEIIKDSHNFHYTIVGPHTYMV